jgi:hypothetical protein
MLGKNFDYYDFQKSNLIKCINDEINLYVVSGFANTPIIKEYVEYLQTRLHGKYYIQNLQSQLENPAAKKMYIPKREKMVIEEHCKDLDQMTFKKPWHRLKEFHKIMKIKEFINELTYKKNTDPGLIERNKATLIEALIEGLHTKRYGKGKTEVKYNIDNMKIESISCLSFNKKDKFYEIDWDDE